MSKKSWLQRPQWSSRTICDRSPAGLPERLTRPKIERWFRSSALREALARDARSGHFDLIHLDELLLARAAPFPSPIPVAQHHHKIDTVLALIKVAGLGQAQFLCIRALNVALGNDVDDDKPETETETEPEPGNGDAEAETDGSPSATTSP